MIKRTAKSNTYPSNWSKYLKQPALRVIPLPKDTNGHGSVFGGWLMSEIDLAGSVIAKEASDKTVTVAVHNIEFLKPIMVGDLVSFYGEIIKTGTTSIRTSIRVFSKRIMPSGADNPSGSERQTTNETEVARAEITYVNIGEDSKARPLENT